MAFKKIPVGMYIRAIPRWNLQNDQFDYRELENFIMRMKELKVSEDYDFDIVTEYDEYCEYCGLQLETWQEPPTEKGGVVVLPGMPVCCEKAQLEFLFNIGTDK